MRVIWGTRAVTMKNAFFMHVLWLCRCESADLREGTMPTPYFQVKPCVGHQNRTVTVLNCARCWHRRDADTRNASIVQRRGAHRKAGRQANSLWVSNSKGSEFYQLRTKHRAEEALLLINAVMKSNVERTERTTRLPCVDTLAIWARLKPVK
jgi:hypothetical protein